MNSFVAVLVVALAALLGACEAGVLAAAPAAVGYVHVVPQNIPPFASRFDFETRVRAAPFIAGLPAPVPAFAAPAPVPAFAGPVPVTGFGAPALAPSAPLLAAPAAAPFFTHAAPALAPYALPSPFYRR